jgi:hypothetical protein
VVEGLVTVSAPIEAPGLQLGSELATVLVPKLFMVTEGDAPARAAADQLLAQAPEPRTLQVYAGRGTGVSVLAAPGAFDALLAFVQQVAP